MPFLILRWVVGLVKSFIISFLQSSNQTCNSFHCFCILTPVHSLLTTRVIEQNTYMVLSLPCLNPTRGFPSPTKSEPIHSAGVEGPSPMLIWSSIISLAPGASTWCPNDKWFVSQQVVFVPTTNIFAHTYLSASNAGPPNPNSILFTWQV